MKWIKKFIPFGNNKIIQPKIEIIIPTYKRPYNLLVIINSFLTQVYYTNQPDEYVVPHEFDMQHWKLHIVSDCEDPELREIAAMYSEFSNIKFSFLADGPHKDWGHTAREYGLQNAKCEWVIMTGDDNYYVPSLISEILTVINNNPDCIFIYWNMLHNGFDYREFNTAPEVKKIDIGSFACKTKLAKRIPIKKIYDADGFFVVDYLNKFKGDVIKIDKVLYVHN